MTSPSAFLYRYTPGKRGSVRIFSCSSTGYWILGAVARLWAGFLLNNDAKRLKIPPTRRLISSHQMVPPIVNTTAGWLIAAATRNSSIEAGKSSRKIGNQLQPPAWVLACVLSKPSPMARHRPRCNPGRTKSRYDRFLGFLTPAYLVKILPCHAFVALLPPAFARDKGIYPFYNQQIACIIDWYGGCNVLK